ncbi:MAG TPA: SRPBCC family protein [Methylomirabilota bacterium]|nr:SRPBCC family protein [Methylomirabilota bacterium]
MAIAVTIETTVARPPAEVFAHIADIDAWPSWLIASGIVRVARSTDGPLNEGEHLEVEQRAAGRAGTFRAQVTALEPPTRLALRGRDGDGVSIDIDAAVVPAGDGTSLRWSIRIGLPLRYRMFESMARPQVERAAALDIEALKRRLESTAAG